MFIAVDHCSAECVGIHAALSGTRHEALEPIRQGVTERFGGVEKDSAMGLSIRHDHGSQYMSRDFHKEITAAPLARRHVFTGRRPRARRQRLCGTPWPSGSNRWRRDGQGRTLKENLLWVRTFRIVEELRLALIDFRQTYNENWLIERHGHRSPAQFRRDQMDKLPLSA